MINGFKKKYILFLLFVVFFSGLNIIISSNLPNLVYAQDTNTSISTYKNSTYGITIKYPHTWSILDSAGIEGTDIEIVSFLSPNQNDNAIVGIHQDKLANGNSDIETYLSSTVALYKNDLHDFKFLASNTNSSLAGNKAYKLVYTYTTNDGFKMKDMEIGTIIGNKIYYVIYDGKDSVFDNYQPVVQNMVDSFKFIPTNKQK
jgi:hypothetical protein